MSLEEVRELVKIYISEWLSIMISDDLSSIALSLLETVMNEAMDRILRKVREGKKLTDSEVLLLFVDHMYKTMNEKFSDSNRRFNDIDKGFDSVDRGSEMSIRKTAHS